MHYLIVFTWKISTNVRDKIGEKIKARTRFMYCDWQETKMKANQDA